MVSGVREESACVVRVWPNKETFQGLHNAPLQGIHLERKYPFSINSHIRGQTPLIWNFKQTATRARCTNDIRIPRSAYSMTLLTLCLVADIRLLKSVSVYLKRANSKANDQRTVEFME